MLLVVFLQNSCDGKDREPIVGVETLILVDRIIDIFFVKKQLRRNSLFFRKMIVSVYPRPQFWVFFHFGNQAVAGSPEVVPPRLYIITLDLFALAKQGQQFGEVKEIRINTKEEEAKMYSKIQDVGDLICQSLLVNLICFVVLASISIGTLFVNKRTF